MSHACPTLVQHLRRARLFVRVNVGSWVSLEVHVSNVRPIYVCIEAACAEVQEESRESWSPANADTDQ